MGISQQLTRINESQSSKHNDTLSFHLSLVLVTVFCFPREGEDMRYFSPKLTGHQSSREELVKSQFSNCCETLSFLFLFSVLFSRPGFYGHQSTVERN
jgi:hypothetical protein